MSVSALSAAGCQYERKPLVVKAEQYLPPEHIPPQVRLVQPEICYSVDRTVFYCTYRRGRMRPQYWVSLLQYDEKPTLKGPWGGVVSILDHDTGKTRWRRLYPFSFYEYKVGETRVVTSEADQELLREFAVIHDWPPPEPLGVLTTTDRGVTVHPTDWVVTFPNGDITVCTHAAFLESYSPSP